MGPLGGAVCRWRSCGGGGGGAGLAAFRAAFRAVLRRRGGRCPCCAGRRCGIVQFLDKVVVLPVVATIAPFESFQLCNRETGTPAFSSVGFGGGEGFFGGCSAFFALLQVVWS